jgi:CYTH domain-containing protein
MLGRTRGGHRLKAPAGVVLSVDEFQDDPEGLRMVEADLDTAERMASFPMPDFPIREVTEDPRFGGGHLVTSGLPREL